MQKHTFQTVPPNIFVLLLLTKPFFFGAWPLTIQVIEDNGVRRVVVVPQAPEFHPGGHAVIHRPPHPPLPGFLPLPAMIPPPPRHMYSPVTGAGDIATQYIPQYHTSQMYGDLGK